MEIFTSVFWLKKYWLSRFGASNRTIADQELNPRLIREETTFDDAGWSLYFCNMHTNPKRIEKCAT
jgi:hypothetical protein